MLPGYIDGIRKGRALPMILPLTEDKDAIGDMMDRLDGFLLTGGQDVSPEVYGERPHEKCGEICEARDKMESLLIEAAIVADKPIFGICRGIQFLNAFLGGTLYQDIPTELRSNVCHAMLPPYDIPVHPVQLFNILREWLGMDVLEVNSYHHQGVKTLSPKLTVCAIAPDGLVEAAYMPDKRFVLAVQWHPEFALQWESSQRLFSAFVQACKGTLNERYTDTQT
jgi:putative glutamine amidotransferase